MIQKKICLLGNFAVGKTSLVRRFVEGRFDEQYLSTIGVHISRKRLQRDDHILSMILWDLAGGEEFAHYHPSYLRGAAGALIVGDLTRGETLHDFTVFRNQMLAVNPGAALVYVGNKLDLTERSTSADEQLRTVREIVTGPYLLTSAKTGEQVERAFHLLADLIENPS